MKVLLTRLLLAVSVLGVLSLLLWKLAGDSTPSLPTNPTGSSPLNEGVSSGPMDGDGGTLTSVTPSVTSSVTPRITPEAVMGAIRRIADTSRRLMPPGYETLYIGMPIQDLRVVRPQARAEADHPSADGNQLWAENDDRGVRVLYVVAQGRTLMSVQFLSQIRSEDAFAPHLQALVARYGTPTGIWDCPESAQVSPMRRFTWRSEGASVMEAVLIHGSSIAVTLIVETTSEMATALANARCEAISNPAQLDHFPTAGTLRGERTNTVREIPRDH